MHDSYAVCFMSYYTVQVYHSKLFGMDDMIETLAIFVQI